MGTARRPVVVADQVWIATALLHREHPERADFASSEIRDRLRAEAIAEDAPAPAGVDTTIAQDCVANKRPQPDKLRMLYETGTGRRRLFRPGDDYHPEREGPPERRGTRITPRREDIPERYHYLLDWYENEYVPQADGNGERDPILALVGLGKEIWNGEHPDEYVRRLREGW
jgi:hypothetical protein